MGSPSLQIGHVMVLPLDALGIIAEVPGIPAEVPGIPAEVPGIPAEVVALDNVGVGGSSCVLSGPCVPFGLCVSSVPSMTVFPTDHHLNKCAYNICENLYTHVRAMP